jgi:hypothetical protein
VIDLRLDAATADLDNDLAPVPSRTRANINQMD